MFCFNTHTHTHTHTHKNKLTYVVCTAELCGDDALHVAMETEEDLNGVNLNLQGAGQVHHLRDTHTHTHTTTELLSNISDTGNTPNCASGAWQRRYLALQRRLTLHHAVPGQQLVPGLSWHQYKVLVLHQTLLQVVRGQIWNQETRADQSRSSWRMKDSFTWRSACS